MWTLKLCSIFHPLEQAVPFLSDGRHACSRTSPSGSWFIVRGTELLYRFLHSLEGCIVVWRLVCSSCRYCLSWSSGFFRRNPPPELQWIPGETTVAPEIFVDLHHWQRHWERKLPGKTPMAPSKAGGHVGYWPICWEIIKKYCPWN